MSKSPGPQGVDTLGSQERLTSDLVPTKGFYPRFYLLSSPSPTVSLQSPLAEWGVDGSEIR